MAVTAKALEGIGPIESGSSYPLADFMRRTGFSRGAVRQARRRGLKVRKVGRRHFILGSDWLSFLESRAALEA